MIHVAAVFALLFLITFSTLAHQWSLSKEPWGHFGHSNIEASITFSFFSIFVWVRVELIQYPDYRDRRVFAGSLLGPGLQEAAAGGGLGAGGLAAGGPGPQQLHGVRVHARDWRRLPGHRRIHGRRTRAASPRRRCEQPVPVPARPAALRCPGHGTSILSATIKRRAALSGVTLLILAEVLIRNNSESCD